MQNQFLKKTKYFVMSNFLTLVPPAGAAACAVLTIVAAMALGAWGKGEQVIVALVTY